MLTEPKIRLVLLLLLLELRILLVLRSELWHACGRVLAEAEFSSVVILLLVMHVALIIVLVVS